MALLFPVIVVAQKKLCGFIVPVIVVAQKKLLVFEFLRGRGRADVNQQNHTKNSKFKFDKKSCQYYGNCNNYYLIDQSDAIDVVRDNQK